jgi:hypothetical protein
MELVEVHLLRAAKENSIAPIKRLNFPFSEKAATNCNSRQVVRRPPRTPGSRRLEETKRERRSKELAAPPDPRVLSISRRLARRCPPALLEMAVSSR